MDRLKRVLEHGISTTKTTEGLSVQHFQPWSSILACVVAYAFLVSSLRYCRVRKSQEKYPTRQSLTTMTDDEGYEIVKQLAELEFPTFFEKGLQFALFRVIVSFNDMHNSALILAPFQTYGIPSISTLLARTAQLSTAKNAGKRYADTGVLVSEIWGNKPSDERSHEALARLNFLHGHYIAQGLISNDDLLYTLSLFLLEPIRWSGFSQEKLLMANSHDQMD